MVNEQPTPQSLKGRKNIYCCDKCSDFIVTVDRDDGVTPFAIKCRTTLGCDGTMYSSMYRVFDQRMKASHEWYKPTVLETLSPGEHAHVRKGGLLLRKIK